MQIVRKLSIWLLVLPFLLIAVSSKTHAQEQTGVSLGVTQIVNFSERSTSIRYEFIIDNQSEDFVKSFKISPGYKATNLNSNEQIIDFSKNPIAPGESRAHYIDFQSSELVEVFADYKRVYIPQFVTNINLSKFETKLNYPNSWGAPSYSSFVSNSNTDIYMLWGDSLELQFSLNFSIQGDDNNRAYPFFGGGDQEIYLNSYSGIDSIVYRDENSYLLLDESSQISMSGTIKLDNLPEKYIEPEKEEEEVIMKILEELRDDYQINNYNDRYNLCIEFSKKINSEGYKSKSILGLDLGGTDINRYKPVCWVEIDKGNSFLGVDPYGVIVKGYAEVRSINPDRVVILNMPLSTGKEILKLDYPFYEVLIVSERFEKASTDKKIELKVDLNSTECKESEIELTISNPTNQIVRIISPEGFSEGILPGRIGNYHLDKSVLKNNNFQLEYLIGNEEYVKDLSFDESDCKTYFDIKGESKNFVLLTSIVFLTILLLSRISTRPLKRISL